jgi:hypothetical protein
MGSSVRTDVVAKRKPVLSGNLNPAIQTLSRSTEISLNADIKKKQQTVAF